MFYLSVVYSVSVQSVVYRNRLYFRLPNLTFVVTAVKRSVTVDLDLVQSLDPIPNTELNARPRLIILTYHTICLIYD